jgi:putative addiction module killer protein
MVQVRQAERFVRWLEGLRDLIGRAKVLARIERLIGGNPGDAKPVGDGVSELRINFGPGYRVYYLQKGSTLIILLAGGDKSSQAKDIQAALQLVNTLSEESQ